MLTLHRAKFVWSGVSMLAVFVVGAAALSQDKPDAAELKSQVESLVKQLDASKATERQAAQESLVKLGRDVLPLLPAADADGQSSELKRRLGDVRKSLGLQAGKVSLAASTVTLSNKNITLSDAVKEISRQTNNEIDDFRAEYGQPETNPEFAVDWKAKPFWEVLDDLAAKSRVGYEMLQGSRQLGLAMRPLPQSPVSYAGPLRIAMKDIQRRLTFEDGKKDFTLAIDVAWEPRLRPMQIELRPDDLVVLDDQDRKIEVDIAKPRPGAEQDESMSSMKAEINRTMLQTDLIIRLAQPPKGAEKIKSLTGKLTVTVPASLQTFEFPDLRKAKNVKQKRGELTITLEQVKVIDEDDNNWHALIVLEFDAKGEAFESYADWYVDNEIWLQKADGTRFPQNSGTSLESSDGRITIRYGFIDAPGKLSDYKLVYRTPSTIVKDTVPFKFENLELP